ncbi:heavy metal translocatin [Sarocladium strictum]
MGASCCPKPIEAQSSDSSPTDHDHGNGHGHGHDDGQDHDVEDSDNHKHAGCCEAETTSVFSDKSTCCDTEECCDEQCINDIAAWECQKACQEDSYHSDSTSHPHEHHDGAHSDATACDNHLSRALDTYMDYLQQVRCICRSAIEMGMAGPERCCSSRRSRRDLASRRKAQMAEKTSKPTFVPSKKVAQYHLAASHKDPEKHDQEQIEHVKFLVSGMDCTTCADKLMRIFGSMTGVSDAQINFITGSGELKMNVAITNTNEVLQFASAASGFDLTKVTGGNHFLDILTSPSESQQLSANPPDGVTDVEVLDKQTVRLRYDPAVTGARVLYDGIRARSRGLAPPRVNPQLENSRRRLWDQLWKTCLAAVLTIPVAVVSWSEGLVAKKTEDIIGLVLGTLVQLIAIPDFYRPALSALWYSRTVEMDMLVVMSITAAYGYSLVAFGFGMAGRPLEEGQFFETSTMLITLILLGRLIAAFARVQAVSAVSLRSRQNNQAVLITAGGDLEIDARLLQYGDRFRVLPHSKVPTDGVVEEGETEIDESMLTGESMPVTKKQGARLIAGTINGNGTVVARLTRLPGDNTVSDIAQLVEEAAKSKPKLQDLANKVAGWFVPVMAVIAVLVMVIWIACGMEVLDYAAGKAIATAITYAVATLAVACPCALGLAVPMVLLVAGGISARGGVVIKSADTTEGVRKTTDVVFDKTGTITEDQLAVAQKAILGDQEDEQTVMRIVKALVAGGKHPVSAAIDKYLDEQSTKGSSDVQGVRVIPGAGVEATYKGMAVMAGNSRWTNTVDLSEVIDCHHAGLTTLVVTLDERPLVVFGLNVRIRPEAELVVATLKARGIAVHLVSGDQKTAVELVANTVGIPPDCVASECTPGDKQQYIAALMEDKTRYVLFCGDGTNDAVAVAQANVGAQMGGGLTSSEVTQGAADVVLLNGLHGIIFLLDISKASFHRIAFNFVWSAVYNILAVTMASGAWVNFRIPPRYAGLGEMVSVVPVIIAAMSMLLLNLKARTVVKSL